jgi:hypothetical protein
VAVVDDAVVAVADVLATVVGPPALVLPMVQDVELEALGFELEPLLW